MVILTETTLEFEEETSFDPLAEMAHEAILLVVPDQTGKNRTFRLKIDAIQKNAAVLRNTTTGLCLKLIGGQWVWVPC